MQGHYLRERGWDALESWREAYAEGRYEAIFNELVRGPFKLDVMLRHKAPRKEALKNLTATECAIVQDYLAGHPLMRFPPSKKGPRQMLAARSKASGRRSSATSCASTSPSHGRSIANRTTPIWIVWYGIPATTTRTRSRWRMLL